MSAEKHGLAPAFVNGQVYYGSSTSIGSEDGSSVSTTGASHGGQQPKVPEGKLSRTQIKNQKKKLKKQAKKQQQQIQEQLRQQMLEKQRGKKKHKAILAAEVRVFVCAFVA